MAFMLRAWLKAASSDNWTMPHITSALYVARGVGSFVAKGKLLLRHSSCVFNMSVLFCFADNGFALRSTACLALTAFQQAWRSIHVLPYR